MMALQCQVYSSNINQHNPDPPQFDNEDYQEETDCGANQ